MPQLEDARRLEAQLDQARLDEQRASFGWWSGGRSTAIATDHAVAVAPGGVEHPIGRAVEVDAIDLVRLPHSAARPRAAARQVRAGAGACASRTRPVKWVVSCSGWLASVRRRDQTAVGDEVVTDRGSGRASNSRVRGSSRKNLHGARNATSSTATTVQPVAAADATSAKPSMPITPGSTGVPSMR